MMETIAEIKRKLKEISDESDNRINRWEHDERVGVRDLIEKWRKRLEKESRKKERFRTMLSFERQARSEGFCLIAGLDEAGRGPLAGPVVAGAVILREDCTLEEIDDSKKLSAARRESLYDRVLEQAVSVGVGIIDAEEIDRINIYQAAKKAMLEAMTALDPEPDYLLVDAMELGSPIPQSSIIKGDARSASIAAASIIAKVTRDRLMAGYAEKYPGYGFERHMGYGTKEHLLALEKYGPCPIHRLTFAPVKSFRR